MKRCKYPRCNEPLPEVLNGRKVRSDVKYCPDKNCRQLDNKIPVTKKPNSRNQIAVTKKGNTRNPTVPEGGRSAKQGEKGEIIKEHNAHFKFELLTDDYLMDPEMWVPYTDPKGRATGKFKNIRVRDACGFTYVPEKHRNKKPPLSVVKGKDTRFIEVHINRDSTKEKVWGLLKEVYYFLLTNMDAEIAWPPITVYWKQGPEKGKPKRDYTVESKFVENVRDKVPLLIGLQVPMRPTDEHENAKIGDGSHSFKIEVLSERLAIIYAHLHGKYNHHLPTEEACEKISTEANDVIHTREKADAIDEKVDTIDERAEMHDLSGGNVSAAIYRNVKDGNAMAKINMNEVIHALNRTAQAIEGQTEVVGTFTQETASHTKLMQNGAEAAESLKVAAKVILDVVAPLVDVANTLKDLAPATPPKRYDRLYKKRFRRK